MSNMGIDKASFQEITEAVEGMSDRQLRDLSDVLKDQFAINRRKMARQMLAVIEDGSRVIIYGNIKPKYLVGLTGEVVQIEGSRVTVALDRGPTNRFTTGRVTFRNASCLRLLED